MNNNDLPELVAPKRAWRHIPRRWAYANTPLPRFVSTPEQLATCPLGARLLALTKGQFAIVDSGDYDRLLRHNWHYSNGYATRWLPREARGDKQQIEYLHWHLIGYPPEGLETDHINRNRLDCRRENLRHVTRQVNQRNKTHKPTRGICLVPGPWDKWHVARLPCWQAQIGGRYLGRYPTAELALAAVKAAE